jgi:hypothetical protein
MACLERDAVKFDKDLQRVEAIVVTAIIAFVALLMGLRKGGKRMVTPLPTEPNSIGFTNPADAIRWLRERAEINRRNAHIPPAQWEARVLPFIAMKLDAAADEIERQREEVERWEQQHARWVIAIVGAGVPAFGTLDEGIAKLAELSERRQDEIDRLNRSLQRCMARAAELGDF